MADCPELLVVAGPNGAGKTTLAIDYASKSGVTYIGADAIAETLAPQDPASVRLESGRRFLQSVHDHLSRKESLIVETTLSGRTFRHTIASAKPLGFKVTIVYLFLKSADVCVARVSQRVRKGGHDVPEADIRRRFSRSVANFWTIYREMGDSWVILYNETSQLLDVAAGSNQNISVRDTTLFRDFTSIAGISEND